MKSDPCDPQLHPIFIEESFRVIKNRMFAKKQKMTSLATKNNPKHSKNQQFWRNRQKSWFCHGEVSSIMGHVMRVN